MGAGSKALNWGAGALSQVGTNDGGVHTATRWDWVDCGEPTDVIQIKSLEISPDPPVPGKNLTIKASGTVSDLIAEGAYADVVVKLGLIKLLTKRFDVCEELDNANSTLQCPIKPDEYTIEETVALPAEIPRAKFQVSARVFTQEELPAACVDLWSA
ncbi:ML domain-domain-containing protein [Leucosporidium creatinivorum]|uniref:Phosphatidylglycerol/phosphatidylinositol transfer protein n=1 Tax=Leucosporidium creatinivorum TaxID=106004 RepID=A0A1Y2F2F8_9BASI|nr:ML domain-domain-containing protein [Leucosporidium creatinivorum]